MSGRTARRRARPRQLLALLKAARPARLARDHQASPQWPTAAQLIEAASVAPGRESDQKPSTARPRRANRPPASHQASGGFTRHDRRKLQAAAISAVVTAVAIGLIVLIGSLVSKPPAPPGPVVTGVLHPLKLLDGWTGQAGYEVSDGIVYLTGSVRPGGQRGPLAVLPAGARPARPIDLVITFGPAGGDGTAEVTPQGEIEVASPAHDHAFVSLAGIAFPVGS